MNRPSVRGKDVMAIRGRKNKEPKISMSSIRKLARRAGVRRISKDMYNNVRELLKKFLEDNLFEMIQVAEYAKRKTITTSNVLLVLKRRGQTLYF